MPGRTEADGSATLMGSPERDRLARTAWSTPTARVPAVGDQGHRGDRGHR
jgi:hypothetical protein